ncbi:MULTISPECIES: beta-class carbonic anhydrase [Paenibacillus]|uniref:beta-class carbonic anhydrase n=1 Tax=Paenibacillus TaxID=44249 RepID=UPI0022B8C62D|nr:carbonic anhydrase [Paenibacillus caseinilyticus]MCZ8521213.1 carbonic anhydrase [Paenibacillus caseinilyticus]
MSTIRTMLEHNRVFVEEKRYTPYQTTKFPDKKLVILTCMDTRLLELLPQALGLRNGDAKIIKNAGAVVSHPFGSIMRSILLAIYELKAEEVCVIGHHECGMANLESANVLESAKRYGIPEEHINTLTQAGIDLKGWLTGFRHIEESVANSVSMIRSHPLFPDSVPVHGLVIHPSTGRLDVVVEGGAVQPRAGAAGS